MGHHRFGLCPPAAADRLGVRELAPALLSPEVHRAPRDAKLRLASELLQGRIPKLRDSPLLFVIPLALSEAEGRADESARGICFLHWT